MDWVSRREGEQGHTYFQRAFSEAAAAKLPLALRHGGGASLGVLGRAPTGQGKGKFLAQGIPQWWGPETTSQWLTE